MPPRNVDADFIGDVSDDSAPTATVEPVVTAATHQQKQPPMQIVWRNVVYYIILHSLSLYGVYCLFYSHPLTWLWTVVLYIIGALGITAGAHRLWSHKAYKAKVPLRAFLAICNSMAGQNHIYEWARDHRVHHKYSETDGDPHNATRGFFFAHMGWLLVRKHPDVKEKGKQIDLSDLHNDPVVMFQKRYYLQSLFIIWFLVPVCVPVFLWGESFASTLCACVFLRYCLNLHATWLVNSVAHMWGNRPYDVQISPVENFLVTFGAIGEGFHNYHHTFPSDYSTSEYGWKFNITTLFIDSMAYIGQAYDLKKMSPKLVNRRKERTGDGSEGFGILSPPKTE